MHQKLNTAPRRLRNRIAVLAATAAVATLFAGCFQDSSETSRSARVDTDISNLSKPFSFGTANGAPAASVEVIAAENLPVLLAGSQQPGASGMLAYEGQPTGFGALGQITGTRRYSFAPAGSEGWNIPEYIGARPQPVRGLPASAALYLDRSFKSLFSSIFKHEELALTLNSASSAKGESPNPFTEARQEAEGAAPPKAAAAAEPPAAKPSEAPKQATNNPPASNSGGGPVNAPPQPRYIFLGDFDGHGSFKAFGADRLDDTTFSFADARRLFSLFINPAAVEQQRSFGIEDIDGDGSADLLVTARASMFGGVLLGGSDGTFTVTDSFLTGYEPTVAAAGLMREGRREIVVTNVRTGAIATFRAAPHYRQIQAQALMDFQPDFISHLIELQSGRDCLMAAQTGKGARVYQWREDSTLNATEDGLPADPTVSLSRDFLQDNALATVQAFQVGPYASITLTNSHRQSFNVANIRVAPHLFIAVGDFSNRGTLDVAVAYLHESTPK